MHGSAKLTLAKGDAKRLKRYQHYVRPLLDPSGTKPEFLLLPGGKPVTQMTHLLHKLEEFGHSCKDSCNLMSETVCLYTDRLYTAGPPFALGILDLQRKGTTNIQYGVSRYYHCIYYQSSNTGLQLYISIIIIIIFIIIVRDLFQERANKLLQPVSCN